MKRRVFVCEVAVSAINVTVVPTEPRYIGGTWSARGIDIESGSDVSWQMHRFGHQRPELESIVELELEPDSWRVANP